MIDITDDVFECLRHAIQIAKDEQVESVDVLRMKLRRAKWPDQTIDAAIDIWRKKNAFPQ